MYKSVSWLFISEVCVFLWKKGDNPNMKPVSSKNRMQNKMINRLSGVISLNKVMGALMMQP
jgi:hypothetical protein